MISLPCILRHCHCVYIFAIRHTVAVLRNYSFDSETAFSKLWYLFLSLIDFRDQCTHNSTCTKLPKPALWSQIGSTSNHQASACVWVPRFLHISSHFLQRLCIDIFVDFLRSLGLCFLKLSLHFWLVSFVTLIALPPCLFFFMFWFGVTCLNCTSIYHWTCKS